MKRRWPARSTLSPTTSITARRTTTTASFQALQTDFSRSLKHGNFLVTETNAQTIGWTSQGQFPPYDGQLREDVYTYLASGANMVEYWHWASIHGNQETYWKGSSLARSRAQPRLRGDEPHGARIAEDRPAVWSG